MIPPFIGGDSPDGEELIYERLASDPDCASWTVLHSLHLAEAKRQVEGEVDFVIIVPGLGVLCLEVKSHRRALRDPDGMWRLGASEPTRKSPFEQASRGMRSVMQYLARTRLDLRDVPFWSAVWFSHAVAGVASSPEWHDWQLLDRHDLRRPISASVSAVLVKARAHMQKTRPAFDESAAAPSTELCLALANQLRPKFELSLTAKEVRKQRDEDRLVFVEEQYQALDQAELDPRALFTGPAGTGKTLLATESANRAALRGERVLLVCFNRLLGKQLEAQFADNDRVTAGTLHKHMRDLTGLQVPEGSGEEWWSQTLPEAALEVALERHGYDVLIVDEAQDLVAETAYLDVLDASLPKGLAGGRWLMFGDFERQNLYGSSDGRVLLAQRAPHFSQPLLRHNCRNTPQIAQAATQLSGLGRDVYRGYRRRDDGFMPEYRTYKQAGEQEALLLSALRTLKEDHYSNDEIVVLAPRTSGVAATASDPGLRSRLAPAESRGLAVAFATVQAFKGLDSPAVILTDLENVTGQEAESLLYVALSRACDRLFVFAREDAMRALAKVITGGARA